jgi:putative transposase
MNHDDDAWAVFWCSILGPILLEDIPAGERRRYLKALSQKEHLLPSGVRKRISLSTLRRKVRAFRGKKIDGLRRQARKDRGVVRRKREKLLERAVELKREQPRRSPFTINKILEVEFGRTIPKSTMNRHLRRVGATRRKLANPDEQPKIRCRWTREQSNALWVGDFAEGPTVFERGQSIKSHLSIWIDCHSRYVVEARYYYRENLDILLDSLLRAWGAQGASRQLYVDNAKISQVDCPRKPSLRLLRRRDYNARRRSFEARQLGRASSPRSRSRPMPSTERTVPPRARRTLRRQSY